MSDFSEFVQALMDRTGLNQPRLAEALGVSQPTVNRWLGGSEPKLAAREKVREYAEQIGFHYDSPTLDSELVRGGGTVLDVKGRVGAGAQIDVSTEQAGQDQVQTVLPLPLGAIGFEIVGDSMWPRYDAGDVIVVMGDGVPVSELPDGVEAVVLTTEDLRFLKKVYRGADDLFNLQSHNAPPMTGVRLKWAADVIATIRRTQWRRISDADRRRMARKAVGKSALNGR